jgi:DNA topoisomerase-1
MAIPYGSCPREGCDGLIVERKTKRKRSFYGCSRYPDCDFMTWEKPSPDSCPLCGSIMVEKSVEGVKKRICQRESCGHSIERADDKKETVLVKT